MKLFVDTNVILDVVVCREPFYKSSQAVLALAERRAIEVCVSALTFNNLYYVTRREIGKRKAMQALRILRDLCGVVTLNAQILNQAIDSSIPDFEDAIQFFSAIHVQADYLIT